MGSLRLAWDWLVRSFSGTPGRRFSGYPAGPIDAAVSALMNGTGRAGRAEALSVPAVLRGRNLICGSISTLPLRQFDANNNVVPLSLLQQIDPDVANGVTLAQTVEDLLFEGISWWRITAFGFDKYPTSARHLDYSTVSLQPPTSNPSLLPGGYDPRGAVVYVDGEPVPAAQIIRFDSPNAPLLVAAARAIRRALLLDRTAELYGGNPRPLDYFAPADGATDPADEDVAAFLGDWAGYRQRRATGYVPGWAQYHTVDTPTPAELQLVELQQRAALDLANAMGLDPEDLGVSTTSRTYQNSTDRRLSKVNDTYSPYMQAIAGRLSMPDVTKRGCRVAFDLDDYLRADPLTRAQVNAIYLDKGVTDVDEVRAEEQLPPLTAAQRRARSAAAQTQPSAPVDNVRALRPVSASFSGPEHTFVSMPSHHEFKVDTEQRTVEGIVLPYGKYAHNGGYKFRFAPDALQLTETSRNKLLRDHAYAAPLGRLLDQRETPGGKWAKYKVARGEDGDRALALADDGVLDGFSVGVDFDLATDTVPDPDEEGALLVRRADWRESSLTAMPAFDDARVTRVAASRTHQQKEEAVPDTETQAAPAAPDLAAQFAAFQQWQQTGQPAEERPTVDPTRRTAALSVAEAKPYRFDRQGNLRRGSHEFSTDVFAATLMNDGAALARVNEFIRAQFDVTTGSVDELNPTRQRLDMYVDQRDFRYPLWDAINKGTLTDVTPFTFPKFNSAGSLVANHTEGNEPSSGTFTTATGGTVTPTAVSGKMKISRETIDQGGNPQVTNLIWRQMLKAWYEALEAFAVSTLDAASPTQIDFSGSPGLADDDLDQAITAEFAKLQFVRGGFSMDNLFTQIDLYLALVAAKGSDGRRLYPALGPTNANGQVRTRYAALDINGVVALPAWALAATGTVAASSYLFDSDSVWGWASNPQRLDFNIEVANLYIGLWGYKAAVITDLAGVREVVYDPA